jgi:hypothetical protein
MAAIEVRNINQGGIAISPYQGAENSVAKMVGLDIHSEPGAVHINQQLTKESGDTVDDFVKAIVVCSDGHEYCFGSTSGKIWRRDDDGSYHLVATASPDSGNAGILDAAEYGDHIYYAMEDKLGRVAVGDPTDWNGRDDNWKTFDVGDADFHPMHQVNLVLFIGDGHQVAQVDDGTFSSNALDVQKPLRVSALGNIDTDLVIGTYVNENVMRTQIVRWDTWSISFSVLDTIPEVGVNAFLEVDNDVIVSAGTKGRLYFYNGKDLEPYTRVPGIFRKGTDDKAIVYPNAAFNFNGIPLFAMSQGKGNAMTYGVYSLGRHSTSFDSVLNIEYLASTLKEKNMEYGAIVGVGDRILVSWRDTTNGDTGIDVLDKDNKFPAAYLEMRVIQGSSEERLGGLSYAFATAAYRELPNGTDIRISRSVNHTAYEEMTSVDDASSLQKYTRAKIGEANTLQVRYDFDVKNNAAPVLEGFFVDIDESSAART